MLSRIVANGIPAYLVGGEFDIFQNGEPLNYAELQNVWDHRSVTAPMKSGQRTTGRYQLIVGPWEHVNGSSVDVDPLELEWFDTWLRNERTGMGSTRTPLHYYDLGTGNFDETADYPFSRAAPTRFYLGSGDSLTTAAPSASLLPASDSLLWSSVGDPCGRPIDQWSMGGVSIPRPRRRHACARCADDDNTGLRRAVDDQLHLVAVLSRWRRSPWTDHRNDPVYASANTPETELVAELEDVTPSGASYPLTEGALLGTLRAVNAKRSWTSHGITILPYHPYTLASAEPVTPGQLTEYQIQVFPTLATIAAGDRLRLTLSTTDTPHLVPLPSQLIELAGGIYTIERTASAPSSLTVGLIR